MIFLDPKYLVHATTANLERLCRALGVDPGKQDGTEEELWRQNLYKHIVGAEVDLFRTDVIAEIAERFGKV